MKKTYGMLAVAAVALMATPALAQIKIGTAGPMTGSNAASANSSSAAPRWRCRTSMPPVA